MPAILPPVDQDQAHAVFDPGAHSRLTGSVSRTRRILTQINMPQNCRHSMVQRAGLSARSGLWSKFPFADY
jgi:hypothetical protein